MIEVRAPSRLHFGLLALHPAAPRQFGGVGVMVEQPALHLRLRAAQGVRVDGPLAARVLRYAETLLANRELNLPLPGVTIDVLSAPPEHVGLGSGTQLAVATARGLLALCAREDVTNQHLARLLGRGKRSAIGLNGFSTGGLLVDGGKTDEEGIAPVVARLPICPDWRFVLVTPRSLRGLHGPSEMQAFRHLPPMPLETTADLCHEVLLTLLPAVAEHDVVRFGQAVYALNRRVGECFAAAQGGVYAGPLLQEVVTFVRSQGIEGVGQSSWGPTLFAVTRDADEAAGLAGMIRTRFAFAPDEVIITSANNDGATIRAAGREPAIRPARRASIG